MDNFLMAERLYLAADYLRRYGHVKNMFALFIGGPMCAVGAINYTYTSDYGDWTYDRPEFKEVAETLGLTSTWDRKPEPHSERWGDTLATWNDRKETTVEDVILAFEQTAANLKGDVDE